MEESAIKFLAQLGVSGCLFVLLWAMNKERFADMKERIGKLETKVEECEEDRNKLWERISQNK